MPIRSLRIPILSSLPTWGGWIEIISVAPWINGVSPSPHGEGGLKCVYSQQSQNYASSLPTWGGWIEMLCLPGPIRGRCWSLPTWGGWIEILSSVPEVASLLVPPRMGRVD